MNATETKQMEKAVAAADKSGAVVAELRAKKNGLVAQLTDVNAAIVEALPVWDADRQTLKELEQQHGVGYYGTGDPALTQTVGA